MTSIKEVIENMTFDRIAQQKRINVANLDQGSVAFPKNFGAKAQLLYINVPIMFSLGPIKCKQGSKLRQTRKES